MNVQKLKISVDQSIFLYTIKNTFERIRIE
jgi:hypothetical protein